MSTPFSRAGCLVLFVVSLSACAPLGRFERTESLAQRTASELRTTQEDELAKHAVLQRDLAALKRRLEGVSGTVVSVPSGDKTTVVFGNQSGHNASATITQRNDEFEDGGTYVRIVRIKRPSDEPAAPAATSLSAPDFTGTESTAWLELSSIGARRQVVVPCGYQVEAKSHKGASVDLLLTYHDQECR